MMEQLADFEERFARQEEKNAELQARVESLEKALLEKETFLEREKRHNKVLSGLLKNKSEKVKAPAAEEAVSEALAAEEPAPAPALEKKKALSPKERGNNGARHKEHFDLEVQEHDIYPEMEDFRPESSKVLRTVDSIRYEFIPPRFIKHIHHLHYYAHEESVVCGTLPATPLLNSRYTASFIAGILQLRYIYSMPIERIVKYFSESGFELSKATAHGLIAKTARLFDTLEEVLREAIHEDPYLHMDESHYTVLEEGPKSTTGKKSCKVYIWAALASHLNLVHFFYEKGSRSRKVLTNYLSPTYHGAVQSDGLEDYKILEGEAYPHAVRLACLQHCKRKFLDMKHEDAVRVVDLMNQLYREVHKIPEDSPPEERQRYKKERMEPLLDDLELLLKEIQKKQSTLPKSNLGKAAGYALREYPSLRNYLLDADYELDNNAIERINRYISLSRHNSLFCGSHEGARRAALTYSLACSCRLHGINTFEYFTDLLNKFISITPNTDKQTLRNLLPDRWKMLSR